MFARRLGATKPRLALSDLSTPAVTQSQLIQPMASNPWARRRIRQTFLLSAVYLLKSSNSESSSFAPEVATDPCVPPFAVYLAAATATPII